MLDIIVFMRWFDQECEISSSSFFNGRNFVLRTFLESSGFWLSFPFTKTSRQSSSVSFIDTRQGFGYPGQHLTASSAGAPSAQSLPWTSKYNSEIKDGAEYSVSKP